MSRRTIRTIRTIRAVAACVVALLAAGPVAAQNKSQINVGFLPGPYADHFRRAIVPILEAKGYRISPIETADGRSLNAGVMDRSIDVNVFQSKGAMDAFNAQSKADLTEVVRVPSAPFGLYSDKIRSFDGMKEGRSVEVPSDPAGLARAMALLQTAGLVKTDPAVDTARATDKTLIENPKKLRFILVDAAQVPRSLVEADFAVVFGHDILAAGRTLASALVLEDPAPQDQVVAVTRAGSANAAWAKDFKAAYQSETFKTFMQTDPKAKGFSTPLYWR